MLDTYFGIQQDCIFSKENVSPHYTLCFLMEDKRSCIPRLVYIILFFTSFLFFQTSANVQPQKVGPKPGEAPPKNQEISLRPNAGVVPPRIVPPSTGDTGKPASWSNKIQPPQPPSGQFSSENILHVRCFCAVLPE